MSYRDIHETEEVKDFQLSQQAKNSLSGDDIPLERLGRLKGWDIPAIRALLAGNWEVAGYDSRRNAELALSRHLGFALERNQQLVVWAFLEVIPGETRFEQDLCHRKDCLYFARSVDWVYNQEISQPKRLNVANLLQEYGPLQVSMLVGMTNNDETPEGMSESSVRRALDYFEAHGVVEKEVIQGVSR